MKILVVYPYVPYPLDRGTHHRTYQLLKALARRHEVHFAALDEGGQGQEHEPVFREFCRSVELIPFAHPPWSRLFPGRFLNPLPSSVAHWTAPGVGWRLGRKLNLGRFDLVHVCDLVTAQYFLGADVPLVVDRSRVDLQFQLAEHSRMGFSARTRLLRCEGYAKLWFYERRVAARSALQIVCGPDDEQFLRRWVRRQMDVEVLVNGVDLDYFTPAGESERAPEPTILFCGAMDYNPNIDSLRWYFSELHAPLRRATPGLKVLVVGKNPTAEVKSHAQREGVTVTGSVPDVRPYYRRAWAQVTPLRIGGGTRLKIVESLAMGTPVISTRIGAQGLDLRHDHDILLADDTDGFVRETTRALQCPRLRETLSINGSKTARDRFSWGSLGARLNQMYQERFDKGVTGRHGHWSAVQHAALQRGRSGVV